MLPVPAPLERLFQRHAVWRGGAHTLPDDTTLPSGFAALDQALPGSGWPTGALTDIHVALPGAEGLRLMLPVLASTPPSPVPRLQAWLAPPHTPFAPALDAAGIDLRAVLVVRPQTRRELLWAAEQVLRSGACRVLLAWLPEIRYTELKRLSVAAGGAPTLAVLFRPLEALHEASPACLRLKLEPRAAGLEIHFMKRRGVSAATSVTLSIDRPVHAMAGPAFPAPRSRDPAARTCAV